VVSFNISDFAAVVVRWIPAVILDFFLVVLDLLFDLIRGKNKSVLDIGIPVDRDELVLVFRVSQDLDGYLPLALAVEIHRYRDGCEAVEEVKQLLGLFVKKFMGIVSQVPMPGGYCHLHRWTSCSVLDVHFDLNATGIVIPLLIEVERTQARKAW
jgi:hypothetical protein